MNCLKCGKSTKDEQVFCAACLEVMAQYPVKPDVHVQIPSRPAAGKKSAHKRPPSAEEQIARLRSRVRRLKVLAFMLTLLFGVACAALVHFASTQEELNWGTNYTYENPFD